jgi:hypothetical protein
MKSNKTVWIVVEKVYHEVKIYKRKQNTKGDYQLVKISNSL